MLIFEKWKSKKVEAPIGNFVQALAYDKVKRNFLKIHNRSKTGYLKVAFSQSEADAGIYILVSPLGFWDFDKAIPRNEILVSGELEICDVIVTTIAY